jgi:diacylglycerol kinase family enzyme
MSGVHVEKTKELKLSAANGQPIYLQLDGEFFGEVPATLKIREDALTLVAPWEP